MNDLLALRAGDVLTQDNLIAIGKLMAEVQQRRKKAIDDSWRINPDTSGGAFTDDEIARSLRQRYDGW